MIGSYMMKRLAKKATSEDEFALAEDANRFSRYILYILYISHPYMYMSESDTYTSVKYHIVIQIVIISVI